MNVRAAVDLATCKPDVFGFHDGVAWLAGDIQRSRQIADLIIVGTADIWETPWLRRRVLEILIRSSGTPVLILPDKQPMGPIHHAILGWKATAEATRAMHALAAFAEPGAAIDVITVGMSLGECQREQNAHAEIKRHLGRHGFQAEGHWVVNDERIKADTLTLYAQEVNADLLVIGGSGHSRIRDIILGSVTRDLVSRSDLPTLIVE